MSYHCCDPRRLEVVKANPQLALNGLESLEVYDSPTADDAKRQRFLLVKFLRAVSLTKENLVISGGERVKRVDIDWVASVATINTAVTDARYLETPDEFKGFTPADEFLVIHTAFPGDFSTYTLRVVAAKDSDGLPDGFDPRLSEIPFSFKVQCASDFDCATAAVCPPPRQIALRLDYLAKDYASFRRLMLDRISTFTPHWRDRHAADVGIMLVELLAYAGDQLSYEQDAVATEAYLGTARLRTSLRRHARLVDYPVHEGCNARVWVQLRTNADGVHVPVGTPLLTRVSELYDRVEPDSEAWRNAVSGGAQVFETVEETILYQDHQRFDFYTWGDRECCLPKGATQATLRNHYPRLKAGDVLVFAEVVGPRTGAPDDADRTRRWAVRLIDVRLTQDPAGELFLPENGGAVTEIRWMAEDALPFPLCISATTDGEYGEVQLDKISVAYGNIVLADHGLTVSSEALGSVPASQIRYARRNDAPNCERAPSARAPARFRPRLSQRPLTHRLSVLREKLFEIETTTVGAALSTFEMHGIALTGPVVVQGEEPVWSVSDGTNAYRLHLNDGIISVYPLSDPAARISAVDPKRARPHITLTSEYEGKPERWAPLPDLLASAADKTEFVVECEHDGTAFLRFGDDECGKRPNTGTVFTATYRVGNGTAGNIGAESIVHIVSDDSRLLSAWNPLPAQGGVDPESAEAIRRDAPQAFRAMERAVTEEDYAQVAQRSAGVQRAAATFRWTGSWHTVFLTVDRVGGGEIDAAYERTMSGHIERHRMAGDDFKIDEPRYVPLQLAMTVCVKPDYFRADVRAALMRVFSNGWLADGRRAFFHPDNFTFGQPVYLSAIVEAAQATEGVATVVVDTFARLREPPDPQAQAQGKLVMGRLEIGRLDNNPNYPERGLLKLTMGGGK